MRGGNRWRTALLSGSVAMAACSGQQAAVEAPTRAVPADCQAFIDHFRPVALQLFDVRVFAVGEAYLPILRPSRDAARVDAIAAFLERPAPPAPKTAPTLLDGMQEIVREQTVDTRGLLAALSREHIEIVPVEHSLPVGPGATRGLDDNLDAPAGAPSPRGLPLRKSSPLFAQQAGFKKCYKAGLVRSQDHDRFDVRLVIDDHGTV